jgi:hypothetical protein
LHAYPQGKGQAAPPIDVEGGGRWQGNRFSVQGHARSPLDLRNTQSPYRIDAHAQAGATRAHARGTLLDPLRLRDFDLKLALSGQDMADLYPLIGVATPPTPPYKLDGRLTRDAKGDRTRAVAAYKRAEALGDNYDNAQELVKKYMGTPFDPKDKQTTAAN